MSNAIDQIQKAIAGLDTRAGKSNVGTIVTLADGVASIDGLSGVMMNEMIELPGGLQGVALNLAEDTVGCVIMGDISRRKEGMEAKTTGRRLSIPGGKGLLDAVLDDRLVDERQHLLGLGLGGRQEAGAQTRDGKDGLANRWNGFGHAMRA